MLIKNIVIFQFGILAEHPDSRKYEYIEFPESDKWGLVMPKNDPLAKKKTIRAKDLAGLPLSSFKPRETGK